jgi:tRNA(Arg) A34 adenosine deaminase TadA
MSEDTSPQHEHEMRRCIDLARRALAPDDVPVGAVVVLDGQIVGEGVERVKARRDVTAHAEIEAVRAACERLDSLNLTRCTLYTSVEPCVMCPYAITLARIGAVVMGAPSLGPEPVFSGRIVLSNGDVLPDRPPPVVVRNVLSRECQAVLTAPKP